ncbi:Aspartate-semialdehyde dehydrogenase [Chlamydiales bacterium SCGC AG-110-P3]|nr:Aspartate-semialdehyde dehydrogenase [Chlamydiales bacterium SCGC AG-110-P3]
MEVYTATLPRIPVAVVGATGAVGQKAIALLEHHPRLKVTQLVSSNAKTGRRYGEAVNWREELPLPNDVADLILSSADEVTCPVAISALPATVAETVELALTERGIHVCSNAAAFRMDPTVPILIPEVNLEHLSLLSKQQHSGKLITNPNCVVAVLAPVLAPVLEITSVRHVSVITLQALSGAGYAGMDALDGTATVIPCIEGEVEKIERETRKILDCPDLPITTQVHRVPVRHGHMVAVQVHYHTVVHPAEVVEAVRKQAERYPHSYAMYSEPSLPQPVQCLDDQDMRIHIGGIRQGGNGDTIAFVALGHNLVRGAAGAAIANLEAAIDANILEVVQE